MLNIFARILVVLRISWIFSSVATGVSINITSKSARIGETEYEFKWNISGSFQKGELFVISSCNITWIVPGNTSCDSLKENNGKPMNVVAMIDGTLNEHNQLNPGESGLNATVIFTGNLTMGHAWWKIKGNQQSYSGLVFVPCLRKMDEVLAYVAGLGWINLEESNIHATTTTTPLGPVLNQTSTTHAQVTTTRKAPTHGKAPKTSSVPNKRLNAGEIAGITIGILFFLVAVVVIVICVWKHKICRHTKKAKEDVETNGLTNGNTTKKHDMTVNYRK